MKKPLLQIALGIGLLVSVSQLAHADWQQTNVLRLKGRDIRCFAVSGGNLFAGTADSGVFLSGNNGASWSMANTGLTDKSIRSLAASGGNVFAGTKSGVFLSTNNGASWNPANTGALKFMNVMSLAVNGGNLFTLADTGDIFLSTDNGANWTRTNTGLISSVASFVVNGTNIFAANWKGGVFLSTDNGASWTQTNTSLVYPCYRSFAANGTNLFAASDSGIFLSTNNGANWTSANTGLPIIRFVSSLMVSGTHLFAGTRNSGVFVSLDNGASWTASGLTNQTINSLAASGTNLYAGTGSGVFRSTNNGATWTPVNTGLSYRFDFDVLSIAVSGDKVFAGSSGTPDSGVFRSADNGDSWTAAGFTSVGSFAVSGTNLFALASSGVFRSTDNAASWSPVSTGFPYGVLSLAVIGTKLYAGTKHTGSDFVPCIFFSTNNGEIWTSANMTQNNNPVSAPVTSFAASGGKLYAGTDGGGVFLSTDGGASWTSPRTGFTGTYDLSLAAIGDNIFETTNRGGVSLSTDNGASWTSANTGLPHNATNIYTKVNSLVVSGPNLFAGTDSGVFLSTNNCQSWTAVNTGFPTSTRVISIALSETYLFAGTGGGVWRGVWRRPLSEMIPVTNNKQQSFAQNSTGSPLIALAQLNHTVLISFSLAKSQPITLKIYNISGREIATLVNRNLGVGEQRLTWDTKDLAAGCYTVRMQAGINIYVKDVLVSR